MECRSPAASRAAVPLRLIVRDVGPPVATPWSLERMTLLAKAHGVMRDAPFRDDAADDWSPDMRRDCQGKVAAALILLHEAGLPLSAMRGYVVLARINGRDGYWKHAALVVRMQPRGEAVDYVLDHLQSGVRTLTWAMRAGLYIEAVPMMRAEPS